jgi:hypothetical protein
MERRRNQVWLHSAPLLRLLHPIDGPVQLEPVLPAVAVIQEKDEELVLQVCCRRDKDAGMLLLSSACFSP